jgi:hypothetical protein
VVDAAADLWKMHFGQTAGNDAITGAASEVPEPPADALLCFGSLLSFAFCAHSGIISAPICDR